MFATRQLTDPAELLRFGNEYKTASEGVTIAQNYLARVKRVVVAYSTAQPDEYLGGYVINDVPPHRYFVAPGNAARDQSLAQFHISEQDLVEIGAIWFRQYQSPAREWHRMLFFASMLHDALQTGRPFILGGSFVRKIQQIQRTVLPLLIYEDNVTVGDVTGSLQLYVGPRQGIWLRFGYTLIVNVFDRLIKQFQRRQATLQSKLPPLIKPTD